MFVICSFELEAVEGQTLISAPVAYTQSTLNRRQLRDGGVAPRPSPPSQSKRVRVHAIRAW